MAQAGHIETFVDTPFWLAVPLYLTSQGLGLAAVGFIVGQCDVLPPDRSHDLPVDDETARRLVSDLVGVGTVILTAEKRVDGTITIGVCENTVSR